MSTWFSFETILGLRFKINKMNTISPSLYLRNYPCYNPIPQRMLCLVFYNQRGVAFKYVGNTYWAILAMRELHISYIDELLPNHDIHQKWSNLV